METVDPFEPGGWDWGGLEPVPRGARRPRRRAPLWAGRARLPTRGDAARRRARDRHGRDRRTGVSRRRLAPAGRRNYESFFVRPHQVGNDDAIQYTPVFQRDLVVAALPRGGVLGAGRVPDRRVVHDPRRRSPASARRCLRRRHDRAGSLQVRELERPVGPGRVGIAPGGPGIHVAKFAYSAEAEFGPAPPPLPAGSDNIVPAWDVSDPSRRRSPPASPSRGGHWTRLERGAERPRRPCPREAASRDGREHRPRPRDDPADRCPARCRCTSASATARVVHLNGARALPRRRHLPLARLPLPREHRLVRHGLPPARAGRQRARDRRLRDLRRLGRGRPFPDAAGPRLPA